ncbi:PEP/pyruvate-binding domain-containing protein [Aestuariimicrobium soli]|uniref:PEP/pyruvate-binding domain-containing protein n=1 Tax=Aestuariimicrobium soli TaxID=2035834 RepID=UPI003EBB70D6
MTSSVVWLDDPHPDPAVLGRKAATLADLRTAGFSVPDGFVVPVDAHPDPDELRRLGRRLGDRLAVRSSAVNEDLEGLSFAGQYETELGVTPDDLPAALARVRASSTSPAALAYLDDHGLPADGGFAVLVQSLVDADVAGVAFTIDPLNGHDTRIVAELVAGLGDKLVDGQVRAERFVHDWWWSQTHERSSLLSPAEERALVRLALDVQTHHGHPCDLEFAFADGQLHLLQARPITTLHHAEIVDQWTNADFKDGGVSSGPCSPMMWSLYRMIWEDWLSTFLLDSALISPRELAPPRRLGRMFLGRPYWNLSVVKKAMETAPGYTERQFDTELGVRITYDGDGTTTGYTPAALARVARAAWRQRRIVAEHRASVQANHDDLLRSAEAHARRLDGPLTRDELADLWLELVFTDYHRSEGTYFWQIFINTIHQQLAKDALTKVVGEEGFYRLISGLPVVSHLRPFLDAWQVSREIRADDARLAWWRSLAREPGGRARIAAELPPEVARLQGDHAHHAVRELDITHPDFDEDTESVVQLVLDLLELDDEHAPQHGRERLRQTYRATLAEGERRLAARPGSGRRVAAFRERVSSTRDMLWWREEARDRSTRYYHLIRRATMALAPHLVTEGWLRRADDIWFLEIGWLRELLAGRLTRAEVAAEVVRQRTYFDSFAHFTPPNEIGRSFDSTATTETDPEGALVGLGASPGRVTGTARVVGGLDEIDRIRPGDILVTRFTDTGWTSKFALVQAVVTEYGGLLCHASIVSREYGIPCVVALHDATALISDGDTITVDGTSGRVSLIEEAS